MVTVPSGRCLHVIILQRQRQMFWSLTIDFWRRTSRFCPFSIFKFDKLHLDSRPHLVSNPVGFKHNVVGFNHLKTLTVMMVWVWPTRVLRHLVHFISFLKCSLWTSPRRLSWALCSWAYDSNPGCHSHLQSHWVQEIGFTAIPPLGKLGFMAWGLLWSETCFSVINTIQLSFLYYITYITYI